MKYDASNVTRGVKEDGENPGYFYAPCVVCGKRINVGNNPPVIIEGRLDVWCFPECKEVVMSRNDYLDYKYGGK